MLLEILYCHKTSLILIYSFEWPCYTFNSWSTHKWDVRKVKKKKRKRIWNEMMCLNSTKEKNAFYYLPSHPVFTHAFTRSLYVKDVKWFSYRGAGWWWWAVFGRNSSEYLIDLKIRNGKLIFWCHEIGRIRKLMWIWSGFINNEICHKTRCRATIINNLNSLCEDEYCRVCRIYPTHIYSQ